MGEPILVVEDEEELRATVEYNLGRAGHAPTGTRSGREAIRMAAALHPALVLLDLTLMERPGRVQTRERLLADAWQSAGDIGVRTVDTHVKRLRSKLGRAGDLIRTVRGVGYSFDMDS